MEYFVKIDEAIRLVKVIWGGQFRKSIKETSEQIYKSRHFLQEKKIGFYHFFYAKQRYFLSGTGKTSKSAIQKSIW